MTNAEITLRIAELQKLYDNAKGTPCETYSRIVGYFRPVKDWNKGQAEQYKDRVNFDVQGGKHG
jgi:anaerobic ribonucleoside-triphosphate reductase